MSGDEQRPGGSVFGSSMGVAVEALSCANGECSAISQAMKKSGFRPLLGAEGRGERPSKRFGGPWRDTGQAKQ